MAYRANNPFRETNPFRDEEDDDFEEIKDVEIARLKQEKRLYHDRCLDSTGRSLQAIADSEALAVETEIELARQGEALDRTEKNLDMMKGQMKQADRHVTTMKSIWGAIGNAFRKEPVVEKPTSSGDSNSKRTRNDNKKGEFVDASNRKKDNVARLDDGPQLVSAYSSHEERLNRNLDDISSGLASLKQHALTLGDTVDRHNDQLIRLDDKVESLDKNFGQTNQKIRKIL